MEAVKVKSWHDYIEEHPTFTGCLIDDVNDIAWFKNGKIHREDGPAIEFAGGTKYWFLNGVRYNSEQDYKIAMRKIKLEKILKQIQG